MRVGVAVLALFPGVLPPDPVEFMFTDTPALFPVLEMVTVPVPVLIVLAHAGDDTARGSSTAVAAAPVTTNRFNCMMTPPSTQLFPPSASRSV